jgi:hypothetical protein
MRALPQTHSLFSRRLSPLWRRLTPVLAAVALAGACLTGTGVTATAAPPNLLTADPLPTWQTNGIVWALEEVNGVVYVGGNFTAVRPPGSAPGHNEVPRKNLAAFDAVTGALLPFSHSITAQTFRYDPDTQTPDVSCTVDWDEHTYTCDTVYKIKKAPDGSKIYVGGDFTSVDGKPRSRVAAFSTTSAHTENPPLDPLFQPRAIDARVRSMAVGPRGVYLGGVFTSVADQPRSRLAALDLTTGAPTSWSPRADRTVIAMAMAPDGSRVLIGGEFDWVNNLAIHGLASLNAEDGSLARWDSRPIPSRSIVTDLTTDADSVYVAADGQSTFDGRLSANPYTGQVNWVDNCLGATWALAVVDDFLYSGSHAHNCSGTPGGFPEQSPHRWFRVLAQTTHAPTQLQYWYPTTNAGDPDLPPERSPTKQGVRAMLGLPGMLWVGGQFTTINGGPQQGLTRFGRTARSAAPLRPATVAAASTAAGVVQVTWRATLDYDDPTLTYEVYRDGTLVHTVQASSSPWLYPALSYTDRAAPPGATVAYRVRAVDPRGTPSNPSFAATVTVAAESHQPYSTAVLASGPSDYWRLADDHGPSLANQAGASGEAEPALTYRGSSGIPSQPQDRSMNFPGTVNGSFHDPELLLSPSAFSVELTFASTSPGKLMGFSNTKTDTPNFWDRLLYLDTFGRVNFGVYGRTTRVATSPWAYADGRWHHVIATLGEAGMHLYIDGTEVASRPPEGPYSTYLGYWRVGGGRLSGWPNADGIVSYLRGSLTNVALYQRQLSASEARLHSDAWRGR